MNEIKPKIKNGSIEQYLHSKKFNKSNNNNIWPNRIVKGGNIPLPTLNSVKLKNEMISLFKTKD